MIGDFYGHQHEHRLAVLVSSSQNEQLLGVPQVDTESGIDIAEAIYDLMLDWKIDKDIMVVCSDTTNCNTGKYGGAIVRLEQMLSRELLYVACRHHMYELTLRAAFEAKFGKTTGVDVPIFSKFKKEWKTFDQKKFEPGIKSKRVVTILKNSINELTQFCSAQIGKNFDRADHKELLQLTLLFLGDGTDAQFRIPGAMHHARWLSKAIYCLKMYLFRSQFNIPNDNKQSLETLCIFIVKFYVKAWILCDSAIQAPNNDLTFLKGVYEFQRFDREISEAVVKKMIGHLWYLADECIAFAIFDENVSFKRKREMAKHILGTNKDDTDKCRRVQVNAHGIRNLMQCEVTDFVTGHTIDFFHRFKFSTEFLKLEPNLWKNNPEYLRAFEAINRMRVVNDSAERGVKLISDFQNALTTKYEEKQYLLQVVSKNRTQFPGHSKQMLKTDKS